MSDWNLTFERGESVTNAELPSVLAGIASLDANSPKNDWMTLGKYSADAEHLGFAQTAATPDGYIVEIRIETPGSSDFGFWKAGRQEPQGAVVYQSKEGRFKTFTNEVLRLAEVTAILEHFYRHFQLHSDFTWRSILDDLLESVPDKSVSEMATLRYHLDPWKTTRFSCAKCGGDYLGSELVDGEMFEDGIERDCPKCHEPVLFLVFESVDELADHPEALAPSERENFARRSDFVSRWRAGLLKSPEQLPELSEDPITLFWDADPDTDEITIRTEDRVIWRQPLGYEHYDYFVDALNPKVKIWPRACGRHPYGTRRVLPLG